MGEGPLPERPRGSTAKRIGRRWASQPRWPDVHLQRGNESLRLAIGGGAKLSARRLVGKLGGMPDCNDPAGPALDTVEKPVGRQDHLSIWEIGKLGDGASGRGELLEPPQDFLCPLAESSRSGWPILANVFQRGQKLCPTRRGESNLHSSPARRTASASARTVSRSCPLPAVISRSPRARSKRIWRSCSPRS